MSMTSTGLIVGANFTNCPTCGRVVPGIFAHVDGCTTKRVRVNYGINRRRPGSRYKRDIEHRNSFLRTSIPDPMGENYERFKNSLFRTVARRHPGWMITGWALAIPPLPHDFEVSEEGISQPKKKLSRRRPKYWYVEGHGWFIFHGTKLEARREGIAEYGRGRVDVVREATQEEIDRYAREKGTI